MENNTVLSLSFEEALDALEDVIAKLNSSQTSLDDAVALYEKGKQLSQYCTQKLEEAQGRIMMLQKDEQGNKQEVEMI